MSLLLTHLSDYSYLERGFHDLLILIWVIYRISTIDGFHSFNLKAIRSFQLKVIASILIIVSLLVMIIYDIIVTVVKYEEGYVMTAAGSIILRPKSLYTVSHKDDIIACDSLLDVSWSFKASSMFMLLATFNHVLVTDGKHTSFMSSWEFRAYRIYSVVSVGCYGLLQAVFSRDPLLTTVVPQFVYHCECFIIANLLQLTNYRIRRLLPTLTNPPTAARMRQFVTLNNFLSICLFLDFIGLFIINTDILVGHKSVQDNKFWTDMLTEIFNTGFSCGYVVMTLILYPTEVTLTAREMQVTKDALSGASRVGLSQSPTQTNTMTYSSVLGPRQSMLKASFATPSVVPSSTQPTSPSNQRMKTIPTNKNSFTYMNASAVTPAGAGYTISPSPPAVTDDEISGIDGSRNQFSNQSSSPTAGSALLLQALPPLAHTTIDGPDSSISSTVNNEYETHTRIIYSPRSTHRIKIHMPTSAASGSPTPSRINSMITSVSSSHTATC